MLEREGSKNTGFKARPIVICQDPYCSDGAVHAVSWIKVRISGVPWEMTLFWDVLPPPAASQDVLWIIEWKL